MTALWIILGVLAALIAVIVVLLHFSVKAYVKADKKGLDLVVKYLGFTVYKLNLPQKEEKAPEPSELSADDISLSEIPEAGDEPSEHPDDAPEPESSDNAPAEKESEQTAGGDAPDEEEKDEEKKPSAPLIDQFNEYKKYIPAGKKAFRKLLKLIRFYDLELDLTVGNDDPYKAGLNFGRINAVFYNLLALLCCIFTVTIKGTSIKCDFEKKALDFYFETAIFVRPSAVVALAAYVGIYYLKIRKSMKKLDKIAKEKQSDE